MSHSTHTTWRAAFLEAVKEHRPLTVVRTRQVHIPWNVFPMHGPASPRLAAEARAVARERVRELAAAGRA